ncbi:MAG: homoserine dehydrogenase [Rhizobiales bacterium]|nr:homoserine dehydrogenase [Hyphomicrobiales bacterium]
MNEPLKIGLAGLGTVGCGVIRMLNNSNGEDIARKLGRPLKVTAVCARDKSKDRGVDISGYSWFDTPEELAQSGDIDVYVELTGGTDGPALEATKIALKRGLDVVTANKAMLAVHSTELAKLAEENGCALLFEAAVAGGIPIVKSLKESLSGNPIQRVYGILNGTCNYMMTAMQNEGKPFDEILKAAQEEGYAEADPSFDVGGIDAAHKLALLTTLSFGTETSFKDIYIEGIEKITPEDIKAAEDLGYRIKLLGVALKTDEGIEQRVHPTLVPSESAIGQVSGVTNCVCVDGDFVGKIMQVGPGAGEGPTASSVVGDLIETARIEKSENNVRPVFTMPVEKLAPYQRAPLRAHEGGYYVRLNLSDRPGTFAAVATRMAEFGISLKSIVQRSHGPEAEELVDAAGVVAAPVVIITHDTTELAVSQALKAIEEDGHIVGQPNMIRIERL